MESFGVNPDKIRKLYEKMNSLGIFDKDIVEKFVHSPGKGGQKVNKASSCVYLKHMPSGIEVKCSQERSQVINRFLARKILTEKLESLLKVKESIERRRIEKIRRQKIRRSKKAKERILREKRIHSEIKSLRKKVVFDEE
ncbi:MAG: peptide chain release factor-like protein [Candidatus Omnitrophica bacterium]|nr:peptide chain release factor-like protein [Candidatus Omnitrophota bacterium]